MVIQLRRILSMMVLSIVASAAVAGPYDNLYVFGDSYSDTGAGYVDGNGPTAVAYLAADLGLPFTFFGAPASAGKGLNFAVSGASTGSGAGTRFPTGDLLGRGMVNQVADFKTLVTTGQVSSDLSRTLFFFEGGLNDASRSVPTVLGNLMSEFRTVYDLGGRNFALTLLPTLVPAFSANAIRLNAAYETFLFALEAALPGSHIYLSDWGLFYDDILRDPARYGFTNTTDRCAGRALFGEDPTPCATPDTYFYYHDSHPSTASHRVVGDRLYQEALANAVPEPSGFVLLGIGSLALLVLGPARRAARRRVDAIGPRAAVCC